MADNWRRGQHDEFRVRREVPWPLGFPPPGNYAEDGDWAEVKDPKGLMMGNRPETDLQALMEEAPQGYGVESVESQDDLREIIADAIDQLDPRERWVFLGNASEGLGLRTIADQLSLSKTQTHRILQSARQHLMEILADHPEIQERLRDD